MRRHAKAFFAAVLAVLCLGTSAAVALQTHSNGTDVSSSGTPNGFITLVGLAIDEGNGDLYAVDSSGAADFSSAIDRFNGAGSFQGQISGAFSNSQDVAVDSSETSSDGNVYLADTGNNLIRAFDASGTPIASFSGDGVLDGSGIPAAQNPDGALASPCGLAVDQATGNLYVADRGHNRIWVFDSSGAYLDGISDSALQGPCGLAFSSTGDLYVRNANVGNVVKFAKAGATDFNFSGVLDSNNTIDVAVDSFDDHVYVTSANQVTEYDSSGSQVSSFGQGQLSNATAVAIDETGEKVYVAEGNSIRTYGPLTTLPDVTTGSASNVQVASATISGTVDPAGGPDASCAFEYGTDRSYGQSAPCEPAGPFSAFQEVTAELSNLTAGQTYHYRLSSTSSNGSAFGEDMTFSTTKEPTIDVVQATEVNSNSARLRVTAEPHGAETSYRFEYGTSTSYESSAPVSDGTFGSTTAVFVGGVGVLHIAAATQSISGLSPGTTYHYRVIATNSAGSVPSEDHTFHTYPAQSGSGPTKDRTYEMVSPPDKGGANIEGNPWQTVSSVDGNAVTYASTGSFAGTGGTGIMLNYLSKRTADGWVTNGLTPEQEAGNSVVPGLTNQSRFTGAFTPDLSKGIFYARVSLFGEPGLAKGNALYLRDDLLSSDGPNPSQGANYQLLSDSVTPISQDEQGFIDIGQPPLGLADTNPSLTRAVYESKHNLTQGTVDASLDESTSKVYEWDDGAQYLGSVLPSGTPTTAVAGRGALTKGFPDAFCPSSSYTHGVGSGSTTFFTAPPFSDVCSKVSNVGGVQGTLYARIGHSVTVKLNESERTDCAGDQTCGGDNVPDPAPDPNGEMPASLWTATPDGSKAFFLTEEALTDDAVFSGRMNLYRYDANQPIRQHLQLIAPDVSTVVGVSNGGEYVYYTTQGFELVRTLYVWHDGEVRVVGTGMGLGTGTDRDWMEGGGFATMRIAPDGRTILFESQTAETGHLSGGNQLTAGDALVPCPMSGDPDYCATETFLYRYDTDKLVCVSCPPTGAAPSTDGGAFNLHFDESSRPDYRAFVSSGRPTQYLTHALSDDGSRAFFTSFDPLVPNDTNGRADAYEYNASTGQVRLLSTGQCNCDSSFVEASPDGHDAFFVTAQRLVGIDKDNNRDLYDARIGGGIAAQDPLPPAQCQGDACQSPAGPPNDATPASSSFIGAGNERGGRQKPPKARRHARKPHKRKKHRRLHRGAQRTQAATTHSHG